MSFFARFAGLESPAKTPFEMVIIHRLAEVTNDAVLQSSIADDLIRVCGNENCRNRIAPIEELSVELDSGHSRHLDVSNQAGGFR